jgi:cytochrome b561
VSVQGAQYGSAAKSFHWVTAALLGAQFTIGWIMPGLRHITQPEGLVSLHFSLGIVVLAVTAARLLWRAAIGVPSPATSLPKWQHQAAQLLHMALYVLLFALTFSGWAYASSHGLAVTFFGLAALPAIFANGSGIGQAIGQLHSPLAWILLTALGLHIAVALAHALIWRDGVMSRMLPRLGEARRPAEPQARWPWRAT